MNDLLEIWSLPWHALQRRLATGFEAERTIPRPTVKPSQSEPDAGEPGSWLKRARNIAAYQAVRASR
jgi:hypothetical protein